MKYQVEPLDIKRFLVQKCARPPVFYLVELDFFGSGKHACACDWYSKNNWNEARSHCKHIQLVQNLIDHANHAQV